MDGTEIKRKITHADDTDGSTSHSGSKPKISRTINACGRCRQRKIKCDRAYPSCASCKKAGVDCIGVDVATGREIPRSYVIHLENKVAELETSLRKYGHVIPDIDESTDNGHDDSKLTSADASPDNKFRKSSVDHLMEKVEMVSVKSSSSQQTSVLGASSGLSFARILFTAVKLHNQDVTANSGTKKFSSKNVKPARLPSKAIAETLLEAFFSQANAQLPVIHREEFIIKYWQPIYGSMSSKTCLASVYTSIAVETSEKDAEMDHNCYYYKHCVHQNEDSDSNAELLGEPNPCLYFLNIIFGIATSIHQQLYSAHISESYRISAAHHFDSVFSSSNRLEALQGMLLLSLYSVMRPSVPGVWYVLGTALRICIDLGLHQEDESLSRWLNKGDIQPYDASTLDMRRRLFWCTYALDRQVCIYLGRPFGIPEESVRARFPSELDDTIIYLNAKHGILDNSKSGNGHKSPSYKTVSLSFIKVRQIQAQVQRILYDGAELPRKFSNLDEWTDFMCARLDEWREWCPKTTKEMNCAFNLAFFDLNYYQTKLLIHGLSPMNTSIKTHSFFVLAEAGLKIIQIYYELHRKKSINYTWVAVHNLFMAGTSYLYSLFYSKAVRAKSSIQDIENNCRSCLTVLNSLEDRCDAATGCKDSFQMLAAAIIKLCNDEKIGISYTPISSSLPSVAEVAKIQTSNYIHPHISNLLNSLPAGASPDVKLDKDRMAPAQQHQPMARQEEPESSLHRDSDKSKNEVELWPEDIDSFFAEAAQVGAISPDSIRHGMSPSPSWHEKYFEPHQKLVDTPSSHEIGSSGRSSLGDIRNQKDGKKIYNMINHVPLTPIWDQFFAPQGTPGSNTNHPW